MKTRNVFSPRLLRIALFAMVAAGMLSAVAAQIHRAPRRPIAAFDDTPMEPLPGWDFSMRVDSARGRMQFLGADARLDAIAPLTRGDAVLAQLRPGLWLAVVRRGERGHGEVSLLPMGHTVAVPDEGIRVADSLSDSLRARLIERGGGVIFVDAGAR